MSLGVLLKIKTNFITNLDITRLIFKNLKIRCDNLNVRSQLNEENVTFDKENNYKIELVTTLLPFI